MQADEIINVYIRLKYMPNEFYNKNVYIAIHTSDG